MPRNTSMSSLSSGTVAFSEPTQSMHGGQGSGGNRGPPGNSAVTNMNQRGRPTTPTKGLNPATGNNNNPAGNNLSSSNLFNSSNGSNPQQQQQQLYGQGGLQTGDIFIDTVGGSHNVNDEKAAHDRWEAELERVKKQKKWEEEIERIRRERLERQLHPELLLIADDETGEGNGKTAPVVKDAACTPCVIS